MNIVSFVVVVITIIFIGILFKGSNFDIEKLVVDDDLNGNYYTYSNKTNKNNDFSVITEFNLENKKIYSKMASDILWDYQREQFSEMGCDFQKCGEGATFSFYKKGNKAFFYDLDDDGIDEVIGYNEAFFFGGNQNEYDLFILKKIDTGYKNISQVSLNDTVQSIKILKSKTNKLHDIELYVNSRYNRDHGIVTYTQ